MKSNIKSARILAAMLLVCVVISYLTHGIQAAVVSFVVGGIAVECIRPRRVSNGVFAYTGATLADIFIPSVYSTIQPNDSPETTAYVESGVAVSNPILKAAAESGTKKVEVPLWDDLDASGEPNYSDDTDDEATPDKVGTDSFDARNAYINKAFGAADLAVEIAGATPGDGNPMTRIKNRFASYWARIFEHRIVAISHGVFNSNVAQDSSDMVHDIALETTVGQGAANYISADAIVEAAFTMGDAFNKLRSIAMHNIPYKRLVKADLIDFVRDSTGTIDIPTYLGQRVIIDDGLPVIAGTTSGFRYVSVLFGAAAIGYGEGTPAVPAEVERNALGGNGGGLEAIVERKTWMIHPFGFDWLENTVTSPGHSPTLANLRLAANWDRKMERKNIPMAFLVTNS